MPSFHFFTHLPNRNYLIVNEIQLLTIRKCRQINGYNEAGGVIVGTIHRRDNTKKLLHEDPPHIQIIDFSTPYQEDRRTHLSFERKAHNHIQFVKEYREETQGFVDYLGEWHTHPEEHPKPSSIDLDNWKKDLQSQFAILIIIGTISEWIGYWDGKKAIQLHPFKHE